MVGGVALDQSGMMGCMALDQSGMMGCVVLDQSDMMSCVTLDQSGMMDGLCGIGPSGTEEPVACDSCTHVARHFYCKCRVYACGYTHAYTRAYSHRPWTSGARRSDSLH